MGIFKPIVLPPWAELGDKVAPTNDEIQTGWPSSAIPPSRQRFNWVLNYCMNGIRYLCKRGIAQWDILETYDIGSYVVGADGDLYKSLVDNNTGNNPVGDTINWYSLIAPPAGLATKVPVGGIMLWSNPTIPAGWHICDGTSGTPDLRDLFVMGAGGGHALGAVGGSPDTTVVSHTHSIASHGHTISDPGHAHSLLNNYVEGTYGSSGLTTPGGGFAFATNNATDVAGTGITVNPSGVETTDPTGSSGVNANIPPFHALFYIMWLGV